MRNTHSVDVSAGDFVLFGGVYIKHYVLYNSLPTDGFVPPGGVRMSGVCQSRRLLNMRLLAVALTVHRRFLLVCSFFKAELRKQGLRLMEDREFGSQASQTNDF